MNISRKEFLNSFFLVIGYAALFFILQIFLFKISFVNTFPDNESLIAWDAAWYHSIATVGYKYWEASNNTGFYFLFPAIWKLSHLNGIGITCLNIVFFGLGFSLFNAIYKLSTIEKILLISIPSMFYMFVPYTEALFFLLSVVCIYGILQKRIILIWISLFLLATTRANAAIFLPVFLFAELLSSDKKDWLRKTGYVLYTYALPLVVGTAVFVIYQYYVTGIWFVYFKVQAAYWDRKFAIPVFPLGSYWGAKVLWLNALALFTGFVAFLTLVKDGFKWLFKNDIQQNRILLISRLYLAAVLFLILFFNPTWNINTTNVFGAHRYALASPFIMVFLVHYTRDKLYKPKDFLLIFLLANAFWLLFSSYEHIQTLLYFNFNSLLVFFYMLIANKKISWPVIAVIAISFLLQMSIFQQFISDVFVD